MNFPRHPQLRFTRGDQAYIIAPAYAASDAGYIGVGDDGIAASALKTAGVAGMLIGSGQPKIGGGL